MFGQNFPSQKRTKMNIFDSDLVWRMQLMIIKGIKFVFNRIDKYF